MISSYDDYVQTLIDNLKQIKLNDGTITPAMCVESADAAQDNKKFAEYCEKHFDIKKKDFYHELHNSRVVQRLGRNPTKPSQFVDLETKRRKLSVKYGGAIIDPNDSDLTIDVLQTQLRIANDDLGLGFKASSINDASDMWFRDQRKLRIPVLAQSIKYDPAKTEDGYKFLVEIANTCFDEDIGLVVAGILKFIHQVKRKMLRLPVYKHLMIVFLGKQGGGKSTLAKNIFSVVDELAKTTDFGAMLDERNIALFSSYILFLDEMSRASTSDAAEIKRIVSADEIARRPLYSNHSVDIRQNTTSIGTSNADNFQDLIKDETGTRRFLGLKTKDLLDWETINNTNWLTVWQAVDENGPDPMEPFADILQVRQEEQREKNRIEEWIDQIDIRYEFGQIEKGHKFSSAELHDKFREYEMKAFPSSYGTSRIVFGRKLGALNKLFTPAARNGEWTYEGETTFKTSVRSLKR